MVEAHSHEVSSYAYATPGCYAGMSVQPSEASWSDELGEFVLPYDVVRTAPNPDETLTAFLNSTYEAAATTADWDRNLTRT
jgi:hypothetical protein